MAIALFGARADDSTVSKFPQRSSGRTSSELLGSALTKTEQDLNSTLARLRDAERRYMNGEDQGIDWAQILQLGQQSLQLMQQLDAMNANRAGLAGGGAAAAAGGKADPATCQMLQRYASECRRNQESMRSTPTGKVGSTGQAGAFGDCYAVYSQAYNARCR